MPAQCTWTNAVSIQVAVIKLIDSSPQPASFVEQANSMYTKATSHYAAKTMLNDDNPSKRMGIVIKRMAFLMTVGLLLFQEGFNNLETEDGIAQ
eukprot:1149523-Pelagomonas_calceolata.AAC.9